MVVGLVIAAVVGLAIGLQATVLGRAAGTVEPLTASLALLLSGTLVGATWATTTGRWSSVAVVVRSWWWVPLGAIGWLLVAGIAFAAARAGAASVLATSVAAQCVTASVLSGRTAFNVRTAAGITLVVAGAALLATGDP